MISRAARIFVFAICLRATTAAQDYTLSFSGPDRFEGPAGPGYRGSYLCELTHSGASGGANGWSFGVRATRGDSNAKPSVPLPSYS